MWDQCPTFRVTKTNTKLLSPIKLETIVLLTTKSTEKNNLIFVVYDEHMYNLQLGFTILNFNVQ